MTKNPNRGNAGMSQMTLVMASLADAHSACLAVPGGTTLDLTMHARCGRGPKRSGPRASSARGLSPEVREGVGGCPGTPPQDRDDDREADDDLGGGDYEHEEHGRLAADLAQPLCHRDEAEVDRVEHQLDAHEHHQRVAP